MKSATIYRGNKSIYVVDNIARIDCDVFGDAAILQVKLTDYQIEQLLSPTRGHLIQDLLAGIPKEVREVFITGLTPAEWDKLFNRTHTVAEYVAMGYVFDDCNVIADELRNQ